MIATILGWWPCYCHPRMVAIIHLSAASNPLVGNRRGGTISRAHVMIQKLQKWRSFWIQKQEKYCSFWIQKLLIWTKKFLDPEIVEMVRFLDPEIVEMVDKSLGEPSLLKMSQNCGKCRLCWDPRTPSFLAKTAPKPFDPLKNSTKIQSNCYNGTTSIIFFIIIYIWFQIIQYTYNTHAILPNGREKRKLIWKKL